MTNLELFEANICHTVTGILIHNYQVLLVKHKKLGFWLPPGGHIEVGELPHLATEREFFEETGIKVKVINNSKFTSNESQFLPNPIATNLHWISQTNYHQRLKTGRPSGCEQHLAYVFLVKPIGPLELHHDPRESTDIGWFNSTQIQTLETKDNIIELLSSLLHTNPTADRF